MLRCQYRPVERKGHGHQLHPPFSLSLGKCAFSFLILQQVSPRAGSDFAAAQWSVPSVYPTMDQQ